MPRLLPTRQLSRTTTPPAAPPVGTVCVARGARGALVAVTAVVVSLAVSPAAADAASAVLLAPADGIVTGAGDLAVRVTTESSEVLERIEASLRQGGGEVAGAVRVALCDDRETCSRRDGDYRFGFDPATGAPFLTGEQARTLANGAYVVRLHLTRPGTSDRETLDVPLTVSAPPAAPADVTADVQGSEVHLRWRPAPEPDVTGYRVEQARNGDWDAVAELPPDAGVIVDRPGLGRHAYRLVTLRPDGRGATYEAASPEVVVDVRSSTTGGSTPGSSTPGSSTGGETSGGGTSADGTSGNGTAGNGTSGGGTSADGPAVPPGPPASDGADVTSGGAATSGTPGDGGVPTLEDAPAATATEAGTPAGDQAPDTAPDPATPTGTPTDDVHLAAPAARAGGWVARGQVLVPLAGGLLFAAAGFGVWRWSRNARQP